MPENEAFDSQDTNEQDTNKIAQICDCLDTLFIISNNYDGNYHKWEITLELKKERTQMMTSQERVFKVNKAIF